MADDGISIFLVFFAALLVFVLILSKYLQENPLLASILPEAAMVIAVGMGAGYIIHLVVGRRYAIRVGSDDEDDYLAAGGGNGGDDEILDEEQQEQQIADDDVGALLSFDPEIFFIFLLPPIIFNTGLRMGALFFRHIQPILMFAVLGTAISAICTAFFMYGVVKSGLSGGFQPTLPELLTFGALISSTDPVSTLAVFQAKRVDPRLFYLCFGESVLNDALAIVLFYSFGKFIVSDEYVADDVAIAVGKFFIDLFLNSVGSLALGAAGGMLAAFLFKQIDMRHNRLVEMSVYVLLIYVPFLIADILNISGIVTILFTGITANRYVVPNLSSITKVNADMVFRLGAHIAETSIFLELGLSVFGMLGHWNWPFIAWSLVAILVARALNVYPLALMFNMFLLRDSTPSPTSTRARWEEQRKGWEVHNTGSRVGSQVKSVPSNSTDLAQNLTSNAAGIVEGPMSPANCSVHSPIAYENPGVMFEGGSNVGGGGGGDPYSGRPGLGYRSNSFSDQSVATEVTATPWERKDLKIRWNTANMLWFSGLRGAVAYACVRTFPDALGHRKEFAMTTMAIVLITVFLLGGTTQLALSCFKIKVGVDEKKYMRSYVREPIVSNWLTNFERRYIFPCVVRDYEIMESIRRDVQRVNEHFSPTSARREEHKPVEPKIEMTESGYLDMCVDHHQDRGLEKLVRTDSLFDYGAY